MSDNRPARCQSGAAATLIAAPQKCPTILAAMQRWPVGHCPDRTPLVQCSVASYSAAESVRSAAKCDVRQRAVAVSLVASSRG